MNFGINLLQYANSININSQKELSNKIQENEKTLSSYTTGKSFPTYKKLVKLCNLLQCDPNTLMKGDVKHTSNMLSEQEEQILSAYRNLSDSDKRIVDYILNIEEIQQYPDNVIRLIDMGEIIPIDTYIEPVSAGDGNIVMTGECVSKLYPSTQISSKASYCARISGDSMNPVYLNGDIVYVDSEEIPTHNSIGIFQYHGNSYCKKYYAQNNIEKLISLNPDQERYPPIIIEDDSLIKQGRIIGKFHAD